MTAFTGWDPRGGKAAQPDPGDVLALSAGDGAAACYELLAVAARGFRPPRFLTVADIPREPAMGFQAVEQRGARPGNEGIRQTWSLLYRPIVETHPRGVDPYAIYLLGVNPPAEATVRDLEVFNDFYTSVHLPEVAERRQAGRAVRYELVSEVKAPYQGAPRYLAIYEVDEQGASQRRHVGPPYSSGPEVWQGHRTPWRLWYRSLSSGTQPH